MNPFLATDGYKTGHHLMYPKGTSLVYSNFTPRSDKHIPKGVEKGYIISFGQQMVMRQIKEMFDKYFFCTQDRSLLKMCVPHSNGDSAMEAKDRKSVV